MGSALLVARAHPGARPVSAQPVVDEALVRALLAEQHPDLADLAVEPVAEGWDNAVFRVGAHLTARLPRREEGAALVANEQRWLPLLEPHLPLPVPSPVRLGEPGAGYPWPWSICAWLPGQTACTAPPADLDLAARDLGAFLGALHRPAPADAPPNPYRGIPLPERDPGLRSALVTLADGPRRLSAATLRWAADRWTTLSATPPWTGPPLWLHGDLHPANLLVHDGRLSAVIDFGDLTAGDPATDLAVAWMVFDVSTRQTLRTAAGGIDEATWARAEGWALALSLAYLVGSPPGSPMVAVAHQTLAALQGPRP